MSVSQSITPEYFQFIDTHLSLKVLDFHLEKVNSEAERSQLLSLKKTQLIKTKLYDQIYKFFEENPSLKNEDEFQSIQNSHNNLESYEEDLKDKIIGFLNIVNNIKNDPNFDFSTPINKKIVISK